MKKHMAYEMAILALQIFRQNRSDSIRELTSSGTNKALRERAVRELEEIDQAIAIFREDMVVFGMKG